MMAQVKWVGGESAGQDVSIRLVTDDELGQETVAFVKIHSQVLVTYSKYFKACLSERWARDSHTDFVLELEADVEYYFDCFARMDSPLLKSFNISREFRDVKSSLELVKVASRIEFHELMESISRYLSTVTWSAEDEVRIREYSTSPGFDRNHAQDLVERLGMDESEEDRHTQLCDVILDCVRNALSCDGTASRCSRTFFNDLLQGVGSATNISFAKTVVTLVTRETQEFLRNFEQACRGRQLTQVPNFQGRLEIILWVMEAFLKTQVAEELVQTFAHLDVQESVGRCNVNIPEVQEAIKDLAEIVVRIYEGVVAGHLLLNTSARIALLEIWHPLLVSRLVSSQYDEATKRLFLTLPLKHQMELIKRHQSTFDDYITTSSLISTMSKGCKWQAVKVNLDAPHPEDSC